ncbi:hypothetical protein QYM36_000029 [Artemia franciscana]|uniref:Phosphoglycerate mutase n=1 Tax=Artemia franciscana TaxID=6661 RepID=A0AA88LKK4_ARTSF|nr:hypothetical protein QYM36_000029 [Artemia franciscana]
MDVRRRIPVKPQDVKNDPGQICDIETDQDHRVALDSDAAQDVEIHDESEDDKSRKGANIILEEIEQSSLPVEKTWRLRRIVKHLDKLSDEAIMGINLPNRIPFVYELDDNLKPIKFLTRVQHTLKVILEKIEQSSLPVEKTWRLRGVVKHLDKLSDKAIMGIPFVDELDEYLKPIKLLAVMDVRRRIPVKPQDVKYDPGQICEIETDQDDRVALDSDAAQDVEIHDESEDDKSRKGANSDLQIITIVITGLNTELLYKIIMVRHGETAWNKENKRCGWFDAPSSEKGIQEADSADQTLKRKCYQFDTAHTSVLSRVQHTLKIILEEIEQSSVPVEKTWRLRGIVKHLDKLSDKAIMGINLPNRIPFVYELDDNLKPIKLLAVMDVRRRIPVKPQDVKNDPGQICEIETDQDDSVALDSDAAQDAEIHGESEDDKSRKGANSDLSKKIPS